MWYMYPVEIYSFIKKNETVICSKRDRIGEHHVKKNEPDSEIQIFYVFTHMQKLDYV